jgi:hypothetical protein
VDKELNVLSHLAEEKKLLCRWINVTEQLHTATAVGSLDIRWE